MIEPLPVGISHMAYRLPRGQTSIDELAASDRLNIPPNVLREFGFQDIFFAQDAAELGDLTIECGKQVLGESGMSAIDIDTLFLYSGLSTEGSAAVQSPLELFRYPLGRAQFELDLGPVAAMALSQRGCCGLLAAVDMAGRLLRAGGTSKKRASLTLVTDGLPVGGKREIIYNLMSDAAGALLVERDSPRNRIVYYHEQAQPYYWDTPERENEVLAAYFPMAQRVIATALAEADLTVDEVSWFVPHNVSLRSWRILAGLLRIPEAKIWSNNIARVGHTVSCDHIINLVDMKKAGALSKGDVLVLFTFGFGASWSCLILQH